MNPCKWDENMKFICMHCGISFDGNNDKFCAQSCRDSHIVALEKRIREAVRDSSSHTERFSNLWINYN